MSAVWKRLPLIVILVAAAAGAVLLRERLSFAALAEHRSRLVDIGPSMP